MKLHEYMAKDVFAKYDVPVPIGIVIKNLDEFDAQKKNVNHPLAIKSQILVGGRGKAGGIKFADTEDEARSIIEQLLGAEIKGLKVN